MKKIIDFDEKMVKALQDYANAHFNGNFSEAVRCFCGSSLNSPP